MALDLALIVVGLAVVLVSGDLLVRGAVGIARALNVPTLLVSLTIVAFGTSAPEMNVAAIAVMEGKPGLALGDIIGSNLANALIVLGLPALLHPIAVRSPGLRLHSLALLVATIAFLAIAAAYGGVGRATGSGLFAGILLYVGLLSWRAARGEKDDPVIDKVEEYCDEAKISGQTLLYVIGGLIGLPLGADLLVDRGAGLAAALDMRQAIVGLTIIALGTTLPELATVAAAAVRKHTDVAMGAVIGSSIFNLLAVGGVAGLFGRAAFDAEAYRAELPALALTTVLVVAMVLAKRDIGRVAGALMCAAYAALIAWIVING
jgi:cation:H+ antiporter